MSANICQHNGEDIAYWGFYCPACHEIAELKDEHAEQIAKLEAQLEGGDSE